MFVQLNKSFFSGDAVDVAKELIGKRLVITACGGCKFVWRIIETEAYKEDENNTGLNICHTDTRTRSCGFIFSEGSNGLIITCGKANTCDNILIRGLMTIIDSNPNKSMHAFLMNGYFGNKTTDDGKRIDLSVPIDLTLPKDKAHVYIEKDTRVENSMGEPISSLRKGIEKKSNNYWNFKLRELNNKTIDVSFFK